MSYLGETYRGEEGYLQMVDDIWNNGDRRSTRTGVVRSMWDAKLCFDLEQGFPALTSKKIAWQTVVGELLWFLSGSRHLRDLKYYTFGDQNSDKWTIWTDDMERWHKEMQLGDVLEDQVGQLYPVQWRKYNDVDEVDQITKLIEGLRERSQERNHIVMAWNPEAIHFNRMALKPCHLGFQCYVDDEKRLHLKWWQRSVDSFLGLPFNIASYALLTHLLAEWTGLKVGSLLADLGDVHVYENHGGAVSKMLNNVIQPPPCLVLPEECKSLDETLQLTSIDFRESLLNYKHSGKITAPLSTG